MSSHGVLVWNPGIKKLVGLPIKSKQYNILVGPSAYVGKYQKYFLF